MDPTELLRLLVNPQRLAVTGAVAAQPGDLRDIAARAAVDERTTLETLARLVHGGLVDNDDGTYRLVGPAWSGIGRQIADVVPDPDPRIGHGMTADERVVLSRFFVGTQLIEIPSSRSKRLVVLERLALEFEPGRFYPEHEVNAILGSFHPDWASLRRHLVDEGLLTRERNQYWRSGGRVPPGDSPKA